MADEGRDEALFAGGGIAVSSGKVVTERGTYAVARIARVRATYSGSGRVAALVLVPAGLVSGALGAWMGEAVLGGAGAMVLVVGLGAAFVRPSGWLYISTGGREELAARGSEADVRAACVAIESAIARR